MCPCIFIQLEIILLPCRNGKESATICSFHPIPVLPSVPFKNLMSLTVGSSPVTQHHLIPSPSISLSPQPFWPSLTYCIQQTHSCHRAQEHAHCYHLHLFFRFQLSHCFFKRSISDHQDYLRFSIYKIAAPCIAPSDHT